MGKKKNILNIALFQIYKFTLILGLDIVQYYSISPNSLVLF